MCVLKMAFCSADVITWGIRKRADRRGQFNYNFLPSLILTRSHVIHFRGNYQWDCSPAWLSNLYGWAVMSCPEGRDEGGDASNCSVYAPPQHTPHGYKGKHTSPASLRWRIRRQFGMLTYSRRNPPVVIIIKITLRYYDLWGKSHCISHWSKCSKEQQTQQFWDVVVSFGRTEAIHVTLFMI